MWCGVVRRGVVVVGALELLWVQKSFVVFFLVSTDLCHMMSLPYVNVTLSKRSHRLHAASGGGWQQSQTSLTDSAVHVPFCEKHMGLEKLVNDV